MASSLSISVPVGGLSESSAFLALGLVCIVGCLAIASWIWKIYNDQLTAEGLATDRKQLLFLALIAIGTLVPIFAVVTGISQLGWIAFIVAVIVLALVITSTVVYGSGISPTDATTTTTTTSSSEVSQQMTWAVNIQMIIVPLIPGVALGHVGFYLFSSWGGFMAFFGIGLLASVLLVFWRANRVYAASTSSPPAITQTVNVDS